jgi:hypothetical protein
MTRGGLHRLTALADWEARQPLPSRALIWATVALAAALPLALLASTAPAPEEGLLQGEGPVFIVLYAVVLAPLWETLTFHLLPGLVLIRALKLRYAVVVVLLTALFTVAHGVNAADPQWSWLSMLTRLPPALVLAHLTASELRREDGHPFGLVALTHATSNAVVVSLVLLGS